MDAQYFLPGYHKLNSTSCFICYRSSLHDPTKLTPYIMVKKNSFSSLWKCFPEYILVVTNYRKSWSFTHSAVKYWFKWWSGKPQTWVWNAEVAWDSLYWFIQVQISAAVTRLSEMCNELCVRQPTLSFKRDWIFMLIQITGAIIRAELTGSLAHSRVMPLENKDNYIITKWCNDLMEVPANEESNWHDHPLKKAVWC